MPDELTGIDELIEIAGLGSKRTKSNLLRNACLTPSALELMAKHAVLTVDEVASILRLSKITTYRGVWNGDIPSVKIGRKIVVPVAGLKALLGETDDEPQPNEGEAA
jgi:excisionase family DNA binding protein